MKCRLCSGAMTRRLDLHECNDCGLMQRHGVEPKNGYTTGHLRPPHIPDLIATVQALQEPGTALDVGCNDGTFALALREAGYRVVGVEPCEPVAAVARARGFAVEPDLSHCSPATTIWCRHVLEHVADLRGCMGYLHHALATGGLLIVELPDVDAAIRLGSPAPLWDEHLSYFERWHVEKILRDHDFDVLATREYAFGGGSNVWVARHG